MDTRIYYAYTVFLSLTKDLNIMNAVIILKESFGVKTKELHSLMRAELDTAGFQKGTLISISAIIGRT